MNPRPAASCRGWLLLISLAVTAPAQEARVLEKEGTVLVTKLGQATVPAQPAMPLGVRDRLGTGEHSRAVLQMSPRWLARVDADTDIELTPGVVGATSRDAISLGLGGLFVYSRETEGELKIVTPAATGGLRGTQLVTRVFRDGRTLMQVIEGEVDLANEKGQVLLRAGEAGEAEPGQPPRKTAVIEATNLLQWALYYPAVIPPDEFGLSPDEQRVLAVSLAAYRTGDLLKALDQLASLPPPASEATRAYRAAVLLATGRVDAARAELAPLPGDQAVRRVLERLIAAVLFREEATGPLPATAGAVLAESYHLQSCGQLTAATESARRATQLAPNDGFAWTRLAELQFSFGRVPEARAALDRGLALTPRNAQAHALHGYLLSADNRLADARAAFLRALEIDGALGHAWLGLGLTKIKAGDLAGGRADLQTAATVEPTRSFYYSYHGKALSQQGEDTLAQKDLLLARQLDPRDPTPWFYSALQSQLTHRYNTGIAELRESLRLNENRRVYRSRFLLDQDRAVRGANLASLYRNSGLTDLSLREATRAVESDYTNASAHLFLANSYDALRDPERLVLRHETAWFNELLLANLLAPVGGGNLAQFVTQQEYSRLFERDGASGSLVTEARKDGYLDLRASLSTTQARLSTGVDYLLHRNDGTRPNNDTRHEEYYWQAKFQATPADIVYALVKGDYQRGGDLLQTADNSASNPDLRFEDRQEPGLALLAWNHRWAPGVHTLLLGGRLAFHQSYAQTEQVLPVLLRDPAALQPGFLRPTPSGSLEYTDPILRNASTPPTAIAGGSLVLSADFQRLIAPYLGQGPALAFLTNTFDTRSQRQFEVYSAELQHIWQAHRHTLLAGARWQDGECAAQALITQDAPSIFYTAPAAGQDIVVNFRRQSCYLYDFLSLTPALTLMAGGTWDSMDHPENFRLPPLSPREIQTERLSGKVGFTYAGPRGIRLRGAYTESLGGVSFDESVRLEPVQFAGFNQAYRTVISESFAGSVEAPVYKTLGLTVEGTLPDNTWWHAGGVRLDEEVSRVRGAFDFLVAPIFPFPGFAILPGGTTEQLSYRETTWHAGLNHLVGDDLALGASFRQTQARLERRFAQLPAVAGADTKDRATLQELTFHASWNAPTGWFARAEATWYDQEATGNTVGSATTDRFTQFHIQAGRRFQRNRHELSVGVMNLGDTDYRLNPLTYTRALPRERTVFARCRLGF